MAELPKAVATFLQQDDAALLLDAHDTDGDAGRAAHEPGERPRVAVVCPDLAAIRLVRAEAVRTSVVGLYLREGAGAPIVVPRPEWPALESMRSRRAQGGWFTVLRFAGPVDVGAVLGEVGRQSVWRASGPAVAPHDVRVINPIGFLVQAAGPVVDLADLDLSAGVTAGLVASLRTAAGVRMTAWHPAVEALALAGVPVVADPATHVPDGPLRAALTAPVDLADPLAREEHSVVLRRAAYDALVAPHVPQPAVSILLATRRAEMLDFALAQVARQRGVEALELVLAPHGFDVDAERVHAAVPDASVVVRPQPAETMFGDVLQAAADAASGTVVMKLDDDDWYGPDVVADLLRARVYSGAELVGMSAELHYLTGRDLTVKRGHPPERYVRFVAGGTMLLGRATLAEVGGFRRVRKFVDAQLIEAVLAAGGAVYRTHGLGYVLRRNPTGHTWQVDDDYLLDPSRVASTREGFHPSRLMEL